MTTTSSLITDEELGQLKTAILNSVLNEQPFPGGEIVLHFPDLPFVLAQEEVYATEPELKGPIRIESLDKPLQLITEKSLKAITGKPGRTVFFNFRTESVGQQLVVHLDANVYTSFEERTSLLSSLRIKFLKEGETWTILEPPSFLSA